MKGTNILFLQQIPEGGQIYPHISRILSCKILKFRGAKVQKRIAIENIVSSGLEKEENVGNTPLDKNPFPPEQELSFPWIRTISS